MKYLLMYRAKPVSPFGITFDEPEQWSEAELPLHFHSSHDDLKKAVNEMQKFPMVLWELYQGEKIPVQQNMRIDGQPLSEFI